MKVDAIETLGPDLHAFAVVFVLTCDDSKRTRIAGRTKVLLDSRNQFLIVHPASGSKDGAAQVERFKLDSFGEDGGLPAMLAARSACGSSLSSLVDCAACAYCSSDAGVRGDPKLQRMLESVLRHQILGACRTAKPSPPSKRTAVDVRAARRMYREFSERALDAGLAAELPDEARRWIAASVVERACRCKADEAGLPTSEIAELFDLLAMQPEMHRLLLSCESEAGAARSDPGGAHRGSLGDDAIRRLFWDLVMCEAWCREVFARLRGDVIPELTPGCGDNPKAAGNPKAAELLQLPQRDRIVAFWECMRLLLRLRLGLWQMRQSQEALQDEMCVVGIRHPRDGACMAVDFYCNGLARDSGRDEQHLRFQFARIIDDPALLWPFDDGQDWDDLERACARWFEREPEMALEDWRASCLADLEEGGRDVSPRSCLCPGLHRWARRQLRSMGKYPVTTVSLLLTLLMLLGMWFVKEGFGTPAGNQSSLALWPHGCYVVAQLLLLAAWVFQRESRRFLPRSFYGTCFVWLISLLPLVELIRKVELIPLLDGGMSENSGLDRLAHRQSAGHDHLVLVGATLAGLLVTFGLILLQIRGRRITRPDLQRRSFTFPRMLQESFASLRDEWRDLWIAGKVVGIAWCGSLWWGSVMFSALACFSLWPAGVSVFGSLFPLSIWAVAIAFISQLMWQDQFLTEPMSHDR